MTNRTDKTMLKREITISINRVFWDTDGYSYKSCGLPASLKGTLLTWKVEGEDEDICEEEAYNLTSEWLSDEYGFCHNGYQGRTVDVKKLPDDAAVDN